MRWILTILTFAVLSSYSQTPIDSLRQAWQNEENSPEDRLRAIADFTKKGYLFQQPDSAVYFTNQQLRLADEFDNVKSMIDALSTKSVAYIILGKYKEGRNSLQSALELCDEIDYDHGKARVLGNYGVLFQEQGLHEKAIDYFMESIKIKEKLGDTRGIANTNGNIGNLYLTIGDSASALEHYHESLKMFEQIGDKKGMGSCLHNIGDLHLHAGNYEKAREYLERSLKIREEIQDKRGIASTSNVLANYYMTEANEQERAEELLERSLILFQEVGDVKGVVEVRISIAGMYYSRKEYKKAEEVYLENLTLTRKTGLRNKTMAIYDGLYRTYKGLGEDTRALEMLEKSMALQDSISRNEIQNALLQQEVQHEYEKQATEDSVRNAEQKKVADALLAKKEAELDRQKGQKLMLYVGLGVITIFAMLMISRFRVTRKKNRLIEEQKGIVEVKNKELLDSINYARRLQDAILPSEDSIDRNLNDWFIYYKPKDIVAGDFYWLEVHEGMTYIAAADCTGHGVPGAMVSVVCSNALSKALVEEGITRPSSILDRTRELVIDRFGKSDKEIKDGMDISLVRLAQEKSPGNQSQAGTKNLLHYEVQFSGANNPLWIIRDGSKEVEEVKGDKQPIGKHAKEEPFTNHSVQVKEGDTIYLFSDGFVDQFGSDSSSISRGKKFKVGRFKDLLVSIAHLPMQEQHARLEQTFESWKGDLEQLDDVCVIGVKL